MHPTDDFWFAPRRRGYGSGKPLTWQGWALTSGYVGLVVGAVLAVLPFSVLGFIVLVCAATTALLVISARKTEGGWRWRSDCGPDQGASAAVRSTKSKSRR